MLKSKMLINVLLILTILSCLHPMNSSFAGDCDTEGSGLTPTFTGGHKYSGNWKPELQFDPSNPDEIERNSSIIIKVIGGCSPYTWSVSEQGFTLENEGQPIGSTNTLSADGTACGAATITVTDCGDTEVVGYVRCTAGQWVNKGIQCNEALAGYEANGFNLISGIQYQPMATYGKYRQMVNCNYTSTYGEYGCAEDWYSHLLAFDGCTGQQPPICINFTPPCETIHPGSIQCEDTVNCARGGCYWTEECDPLNYCAASKMGFSCLTYFFYEWECP